MILETKLALDWAKENRDKLSGSRNSKPEDFEYANKMYYCVKSKYDELMSEWIKINCIEPKKEII